MSKGSKALSVGDFKDELPPRLLLILHLAIKIMNEEVLLKKIYETSGSREIGFLEGFNDELSCVKIEVLIPILFMKFPDLFSFDFMLEGINLYEDLTKEEWIDAFIVVSKSNFYCKLYFYSFFKKYLGIDVLKIYESQLREYYEDLKELKQFLKNRSGYSTFGFIDQKKLEKRKLERSHLFDKGKTIREIICT